MKSIIKIILGFALLTSYACSSAQQATPSPSTEVQAPQRGQERQGPQELLNKLQLSEQQAASFKVIKDKYRSEVEALRADRSGDRRAMKEKMDSIRDRENKELKEILSDEQYEVYIEDQKNRRPPGPPRGRPGNGAYK